MPPSSHAPDPSSSSDTALDVRAALALLPPDQQSALVLVDMLGYSVADAAAVLRVSQGTVKSRCSRGRARLVPHLSHLRPDAGGGLGAGAGAAGESGVSRGNGGAEEGSGRGAGRWRRNRSAPRHVEPSREGGGKQP